MVPSHQHHGRRVREEDGEEAEEVEGAGDDHESESPAEPLNTDSSHETPNEAAHRK